jgi:RNA polymerase sigma-70 factor, ECF subfamily
MAIARLPLEQREVVLLIGLEGIRYDEAAKILHVPIGTVRSRLSRARETLRQLFERDEETPEAA